MGVLNMRYRANEMQIVSSCPELPIIILYPPISSSGTVLFYQQHPQNIQEERPKQLRLRPQLYLQIEENGRHTHIP